MTPPHPVPGGKRALAEHLRRVHRRDAWSAVPLERWSADELRAEHRRYHAVPAPRTGSITA